MRHRKMIAIVMVSCLSSMALGGILPDREERVLRQVAAEYRLTSHQTKLLLTIRKIENGRPGLEMGVGDGIPDHPARRYAGSFWESLRLQARWAAGTIKKRYEGNLTKFGQRYCPANWKVWTRNATHYMTKQEEVEDDYASGDADTVNPRLPDSEMFLSERDG